MKILKRREFSFDRLEEIKIKLSEIVELRDTKELCIYTTGSYGRLEASRFSDIDLFFLTKKQNVSKISKTIIDAEIIKMCRELKLPEFSGGGEYLEIHIVDHMLEELGSRKDDYYNFFTARILLLLESKPLYNEAVYDSIIAETLNRYYKDFHDHNKDFQPVFLVNDIMRFWRTMCLNYEHSRDM